MSLRKFLIMIIISFMILFVSSCDSRNAPDLYFYIDQMVALPETIYADNNQTFSEIDVTVKDQDDNIVEGKTVHFDCDIGNIIFEISTDETGVATTTFWDNNEVGTATITASINNDSKSVEVLIEEPEYFIESISADPDTIYADDNLTMSLIEVYVKYQDENIGKFVDVYFSTDVGEIVSVVTTDENGKAVSALRDNNEIGLATATAAIDNSVESVQVWIVEVP